MNRKVLGVVVLFLIGLVTIGGFKLVHSLFMKQAEVAGSDAKVNRVFKVAGDPYVGYFFLRSPVMKLEAARRGIGIEFINDGGNYADRNARFNAGEYDAMMLPYNSYLEHGEQYKYPGVSPAAIGRSKGADAVLAFKHKLPTGKVTDLNDASLKIVYTKDSPSSFLLDLAITDFDLFNLAKTDSWRKEVDGSNAVLECARRREGDVFVMWEPDVSRALKEIPDLQVVWSSKDFAGYIVDGFVFRREVTTHEEADVVSFFEAYFSTMRTYKNNRAQLIADVKAMGLVDSAPGVPPLTTEEVEKMLNEVEFYDLQANCLTQLGIRSDPGDNPIQGVVNTIQACTNVLLRTNHLKKAPVDPFNFINTSILQQVKQRLPADIGSSSFTRAYRTLSDSEFASLPEMGVMRVDPITFAPDSAELDADGEAQVDAYAKLLTINYPDTRVMLRGHTGTGSDEGALVKLSEERAQTVMKRLIEKHGMSPERFRTEGKGSAQPPQRRPEEGERAYMYRKPRVEFVLFADNGF